MANTDLNIVLRLVDEASAKIKSAQEEIKKATGEAGDESKKAHEKAGKAAEKHKSALGQVRTTVQNLRKEMFIFTAAIAAATIAIKEYAKFNDEARHKVDEFNIAIANTKLTLGAVINEFLRVKNISALDLFGPLGTLTKAFKAAKDSGGLGAAIGKSSDLILATSDLERFNTALKDAGVLFQAGKISASEYYSTVSQSANSVIAQNQAIGESLRQLAALQSEIGNRQLLEAQTRVDEQIAHLNFYKETFQKAHAGMAAFTVAVGQSIQTNLSSALAGVITGALTAKEAFAQLGRAMIQTVVDFMVQKVVAFALEKTLLAGTVAATAAAGAAIAASWAPAAFLATVATLGAAAAQAPASLAAAGAASTAVMATLGTAMKGAVGGINSEKVGFSQGSFASGTPSIPSDMFAQVHKKEMIIPATFSEGVRRGDLTIGGPKGESASGGTVIVNVYYPKMSKKEEAEELASALGFNLQKELRYVR